MTGILSTFIRNAVEHASYVWVELTLACIAVAFYYTCQSLKRKAKASKMKSSSGSLKQDQFKGVDLEQELTPAQQAAGALRRGKIAEAIDLINELPETMNGNVPEALARSLLNVVTKIPRSPQITYKLESLAGLIGSAPLEAALDHALKNKDVAACRQLHGLSNMLDIFRSQQTLETLVQAYSFDSPALHTLVEEVPKPLPKQFAAMVLETGVAQTDSGMVTEVFEKVDAADEEYLRGVLEKATSSPKRSGSPSTDRTATPPLESDNSTDSAGDLSSLKNAINSMGSASKTISSKEISMRANDIRSCGKNGDLRGAIKVFQRLGSQAENSVIVNSMVEACNECKDMDAAREFFDQAKKLGLADASVYNAMMKGCISSGQETEAKELLSELSDKGMSASRSSFHGLLNARVNARDLKGAWKLVEEMQAIGMHPNAVTCSILMKGKLNSLGDLSRVLALIDAMEQPMDEVLFLAVVEACIRTGRLDVLARQFDKFLEQCPTVCLSAPTFGTMIKAYGHARDIKRVWVFWDTMLAHKAQPTAVTLGCMVESLIVNGCALDAWQLTQKMWSDEKTKLLVNTVIYSSILKGFASNKETDKLLAVYEEMKANAITPNTITFNTILNAFAQGGCMNRVPSLLEDMKSADPPVEPDIVTYSTIVKGFCNAGSLDRALKVLKDMKASGKHAPDEVMYNSLLSGCAKEHRPDEALQLLSDMKKSGVAPSNYTLSMLVKLMGRCKRLNQAFVMLEDISKEYGLKINVQVYTCLIQGCFNAGQPGKAVALHEKIISENLQPDAMTYTVLVRGLLQCGHVDKAVDLARCAHGLGNLPKSKCTPPGLAAGCLDEVVTALGGPSNEAAWELKTELRDFQPAAKGGGKGKGKGKDTREKQGAARTHGAPGLQRQGSGRAPESKAEGRADTEHPWRTVTR
jgi:pentatricopeptide repeat protein